MNSKPLIRWIFGGNPSLGGYETLLESIRLIKKLHRDRFRLLVCYNNILDEYRHNIEKFGVETLEQSPNKYGLIPKGFSWKLYPARLAFDNHEIIIDNDVIIYKKLEEIEAFLTSNKLLITEAHIRNYGKYENIVPKDILINSGVIGLPPMFDFELEIEKAIKKVNLQQWEGFDEQGLVAFVVSSNNFILIKTQKILPINQALPLELGTHGVHFAFVNRSETHMAWEDYKKLKIL